MKTDQAELSDCPLTAAQFLRPALLSEKPLHAEHELLTLAFQAQEEQPIPTDEELYRRCPMCMQKKYLETYQKHLDRC